MTELDCRTCGACCRDLAAIEDRTLCSISEDEALVLPHALVQRRQDTRWGELGLATDELGRCLGLRGEIGEEVTCAVYEQRPDACRWFRSGSEGCRMARDEAGMVTPEDLAKRVGVNAQGDTAPVLDPPAASFAAPCASWATTADDAAAFSSAPDRMLVPVGGCRRGSP